ncbi:MAG: hypothetical protein ACKOB4_06570, partial [Acidobacteriota bacterium]
MSPRKRVETPNTGPVIRWCFPSIGSFTFLLTLYLLLISSWRFLLDSDTGWHIRNGQLILATGSVPRTDPFSYSMAGREWFAWEWLADVLMALAHQSRGLAGVVAGALIILLLAFGLLYQIMIRRGSDPLLASGVALFAAICGIVHWLARPHLFSILLLILWLALVESYRRHRTRWIYLTPLLVVVWANIHGAFAIIFAMLFIYGLGEAIEQLRRGEWRMAPLATYGGVGLFSILAALVTPYGLGLYRHIWKFLNDRELLASTQEFQSPDFHLLDGKLVEALLILGGVAIFLAWREGRVVEVGLYLLWAHLTLQSERHVTLAAVTLAPIIAEQYSRAAAAFLDRAAALDWRGRRILRAIIDWYGGILRIDRQVTGALIYLAAIIFVVGLTGSSWADKLLSPRFSPAKFPVAASEFIENQRLSGNGYAHDQFGGYLIYRLWPGYKVFVDGRGDFYRQGTVLDDMEKVTLVRPEWATKLDQYEIKWLLLRR